MRRLFGLFLLCAVQVFAQPSLPQHTIISASATDFPSQQYIDVGFSDKLSVQAADDLRTDNVTLTVPSKAELAVTGVERLGGRPRMLRVRFSGTLAPSDGS
ncbi:MAG TPA: hypothetical protein VI685_00825, partial [Candidatus Angelobacter sp.]